VRVPGSEGILAAIGEIATKASAWLSVLSLSGDTVQQDYYRHYGYAADAPNFAKGLLPGSFATTANGPPLTGLQAQQQLALPARSGLPNAYYNVTVPRGLVPVEGPTPVEPEPDYNNAPGGGIQYRFPEGTPPGSVTGPYPLPP